MSRILRADVDNPNRLCNMDWSTVDSLEPSDILYYYDVFSTASLTKTIETHGVPGGIIMDQEYLAEPQCAPTYYIPCLHPNFTRVKRAINLFEKTLSQDPPAVTHCFNFSVNRKTQDRYLLLKLIEWFDLDRYLHTWSGIGSEFDCTNIIKEINSIDANWLTSEFKQYMLSAIFKIQPRWHEPPPPIVTGFQNIAVNGARKYDGEIDNRWDCLSHDYLHTAVSLITESSHNNEPNVIFTEKTCWAMLGLNFPIWVGSYAQAQHMQRLGFDVFDDVINHDYQYCDTLLERCYHAIADNIELLTNINKCQILRNQHLSRLLSNRAILSRLELSAWEQEEITRLPTWAQQEIFKISWVHDRIVLTNQNLS